MAGRKKKSGAAAAKRARERITPLSEREVRRFCRCLGLALRGYRERRRLTVKELAGLAFIDPRTVDRIERRGRCRSDTLEHLAEVFGLKLSTILLKAEHMAGKPFS
jgi:hypothetical protein